MIKCTLIPALVFSLFSSLQATNDETEQEKRRSSAIVGRTLYKMAGDVFPNHPNHLVKEVSEGADASITHKPATSTLSLGSVAYLTPAVVLHHKYFQRKSAEAAIKSFKITPNPLGLSVENEDALLMSTSIYASIPIPLHAKASNIELLIFDEPSAVAYADYAPTVAHGLKEILCSYLPPVYGNGTLPQLETITIIDSDARIFEALIQEEGTLKEALSVHYALEDAIPTHASSHINHYWKLTYRLNK